MTQWIRCLTQDQKVWGSIPIAGHVQRCQANNSFRNASVYSDGCLMNKICVTCALYCPRGNEIVQVVGR